MAWCALVIQTSDLQLFACLAPPLTQEVVRPTLTAGPKVGDPNIINTSIEKTPFNDNHDSRPSLIIPKYFWDIVHITKRRAYFPISTYKLLSERCRDDFLKFAPI